jgi:nitrogenase-stabilizing/protective protein
MSDSDLDLDLDELSSAEDFLDYFKVPYDPAVVHVNRLHILQRFHDYLAKIAMPDDDDAKRSIYTEWLTKAYNDFVASDAQTEKVFKVFKMHEPSTTFVSADDLIKRA